MRGGTAADWPACWNMDVSYTSEYVWQLRARPDGAAYSANLTRVRLPRPVTLRDPLWGGDRGMTDSNDGALVVAENQAGIAGFAALVADPLRGVDVILMLAVAVHARRRGIGRQLLSAAMKVAAGRGRRAICATLQARNYPAIEFFMSAGFSVAGFDEQFYPSTDVAVFFSSRLRAA